MPDGNHLEMGLHVFFGCYYNLFDLMKQVGAFDASAPEGTYPHLCESWRATGGLDFRFITGAPFNGLKAFFTTNQLSPRDKVHNSLALATSPVVRGLVDFEGAMRQIRALDSISFADWFRKQGGNQSSLKRMWDPIAYALGFINTENFCPLHVDYLSIFAARTEASVLRMLEGSPDTYLHQPIVNYLHGTGHTNSYSAGSAAGAI
jgi:zeta-carotene desaturase